MEISRRQFGVGAAAASASFIVPTFTIAPPIMDDDEIIIDGIHTVLTQARRLVASPDNWLQGDGFAWKSDGTGMYSIEGAINLSFVRYMYPAAGVGDVMLLYNAYQKPHDLPITEGTDALMDGVIHQHWPKFKHRIPWNEDPHRRHDEVLLALDYGIAEAPNWHLYHPIYC